MENIALMNVGKANQTMSSREIAELTGKDHRNVLRDCDTLNESYLKLGLAQISAGVYYHPNTGKQQHRELLLDRMQTFDLMTGYNTELRIKVNRRWEELETQHRLPQSFSEALMLAARQAEEIERKDIQLQEQKPKVLFADSVATSKTSILVGELAKLINQNGVDIGANRLFDYLRENGYLIKRKGSDYNMPTQKAMELGLFEIKERAINNPDGTIRLTKTSKVTGKGQVFFVNHFLRLFKPEKGI